MSLLSHMGQKCLISSLNVIYIWCGEQRSKVVKSKTLPRIREGSEIVTCRIVRFFHKLNFNHCKNSCTLIICHKKVIITCMKKLIIKKICNNLTTTNTIPCFDTWQSIKNKTPEQSRVLATSASRERSSETPRPSETDKRGNNWMKKKEGEDGVSLQQISS